MATFSKATFNTVRYAAARPTYPQQLFDLVFDFHARGPAAVSASAETDADADAGGGAPPPPPRWDAALDLGCGTGQATRALTRFAHVTGVDPSAAMIARARAASPSAPTDATAFDFVAGPAERLPLLAAASVDLVVSAQAAHWFDWGALWPELARVVRPGGSVAFWGYSQFRLAAHPGLTPLIREYSQGRDPATSLGPHWEQPGRALLDAHLVGIPRAPAAFGRAAHVYFTGAHHPALPAPRPVLLRSAASWAGFEAYLRTFSALHTFAERNPGDAARADGDIVSRFVRQVKDAVRAEAGEEGEGVEIEWPLALVMVKRL